MKIPSQILIIRLSSIGDILLSFPLIQALRREYPDTAIDYIVGKDYADILTPVRPLLREVITYDKKKGRPETRRIRKIIREKEYPLIADLHNNLRTLRLTYRQSGTVTRFRKYRIRRFFYVKWRWNVYAADSVRRRYLQTLRLTFQDTGFRPLDFQPEKDIRERLIKDIPALAAHNRCVLIFPGARHFTKRWPLEYYQTLIHMLLAKTDLTIIIGGGRDEAAYVQPLLKPGQSRIIDACGKYGLYESFTLIALSDLIISNDSAPMHIAALLGKPQIAIFGNTVRQFGFYPENPRAVILEDNSVSCRPCSHIGYEKCPQKHFDCMRKITPAMVFEKIIAFL